MFTNSIDGNAYNRFVNLDGVEFRILDYLAKTDNKYCQNLFKVLKYDTEDCLSKPDLSYAEKMSLLYANNGDASGKRIFLMPYIDDAFDQQGSYLHIYVQSVFPQNHVVSAVNVGIEVITHNKICNIYGDAAVTNQYTNPAEIDSNGSPIIIYKSRVTEMLKCVLASLNGTFVAGVGTLQFNSTIQGSESKAQKEQWNGKKFFGHSIVLTTLMSGATNRMNCGY